MVSAIKANQLMKIRILRATKEFLAVFTASLKVILLLTLSSLSALADPEAALSMVPRGKVIERYGRAYVMKTSAGTKINIEFSLEGRFQEAFGKNLNKGDELEPGEGLISLSSAALKLKEKGLAAEGFWVIEKDHKRGWIYEFKNAILDAKTGKIIQKNLATD